ncbi:hypothetical protein TorRG33x02_225240 [Trema orientale]|uniref:Uncharacterized protein n=1 Tax=Trema orientale TaxID=63057 RepID=A0A2P5E836_TREOI|nr:hypothetical protein TorRG33x02_225240 [Trema orientale]
MDAGGPVAARRSGNGLGLATLVTSSISDTSPPTYGSSERAGWCSKAYFIVSYSIYQINFAHLRNES